MYRSVGALVFGVTAISLIVAIAVAVPAEPPAPIAAEGTVPARPGSGISFGFVDMDGFAIEGETWTFDHGDPDPFEGWTATDLVVDSSAYFRHITSAIWDSDPNHTVMAPILTGAGTAWLGATGIEANGLCWAGGLGYGNGWCQRLASPFLGYSGSGDINLNFNFFNDTEPDFDFTRLSVVTLPSGVRTQLEEFTGARGLSPNHPADTPVGESYVGVISEVIFQGDTSFQLVFELVSDGAWSDEDGLFVTEYGPFGVDDVLVSGALSGGDVSYDFDSDLDGWAAETCPSPGALFDVADVSVYFIEDPIGCGISGSVVEFHDAAQEHPEGQYVRAVSNPVDVANDVDLGSGSALTVSASWDQYSDLPRANGVFYRPAWEYFPATCPGTGEILWSGPVGEPLFLFGSDSPTCDHLVSVAPAELPDTMEQTRFLYEVWSSCDAFGIPPEECTQVTNFTPLIDNLQIHFATQTPVVETLEFFQVDWIGDLDTPVFDSELGDISFRIDPGTPSGFLNVMLSDLSETAESWAVQNLPVSDAFDLEKPLEIRVFIDLETIGISRGTAVEALLYSATFDSQSLSEAPAIPTYGPAVVSDYLFDAGGAYDSTSAAGSTFVPSHFWPVAAPSHPPVVDIGSRISEKLPIVEEQKNECGPGSVARNLLYLAMADSCVHLEADIDTGPKLLSKFKEYSGWNANGIDQVEMLHGKTEIAKNHPDLNIYTKFMAGAGRVPGGNYVGPGAKPRVMALRAGNNAPNWDWVKSEIDKGEVVEVYLTYLKANGERMKVGHLMSVANYWKDVQAETKGFYVQDDEKQGVDDGENRYRQLQWVDNPNGTSQLSPFRKNVIDMVVSQSPQCKPTVDTATCTVSWDTIDTNARKGKLRIKNGRTGRFESWTTGTDKVPHPKYEPFTTTNTTGSTKTWTFCVPNDGNINGGKFRVKRNVPPFAEGAPSTTAELEVSAVTFNGSVWVLDPWSGVTAKQARIPMIAAAFDDATVYAIVDIDTYAASNHNGPAAGAWDLDTTLESLGIDIINGQATGLDGIWFATTPFDFDSLSTPPFFPDGGASAWLDRSEFEALHGPLFIEQEFAIGGDVVSAPIDAPGIVSRLSVYPNPVSDWTVLFLDLPESGDAELGVFDVTGRQIRSLLHENLSAGRHEFRWSAATVDRLPPGIYFVRLTGVNYTESVRVLVIR